jgi:hypothetical protein
MTKPPQSLPKRRTTFKLEVVRDSAISYFNFVIGNLDENDLNDELLSFFALLELKARYLIDLAAGDAGFRLRHPDADMQGLLKASTKHGRIIDSGDELSWY